MKIDSLINIQEKNDYKKTNLKTYQQLVGKLIYLSCSIRPDIIFVMRQLNKRNADPKIDHIKVAKQIIHYLKDMMYLGLKYENTLPSNR